MEQQEANNPNVKRFVMRLMDTTTKAADGSVIPRSVWESYLSSKEYEKAVKRHLIMGGITHLNRRLKSDEDGTGPDDGILINENITHIIEKVYFKSPEDPCVYADCVTLDPTKFSGAQHDKIQNLIGMLSSGMFLPISIVVSADWNPREEATQIVQLLGADVTLNPSFKGASIIKIFSETADKHVRTFSNAGGIGEEVKESRFFSYETETTYKLMLYQKPIFYQLYQMIRGYRLYFLSHPSCNERNFKQLIIQDFTHILTELDKPIRNRKNISVMLALVGYSQELKTAFTTYADVHYNTLINKEANGFILKGRFEREMEALRNLYDAVIKEITQSKMSLSATDSSLQLI